MKKVLIIIIVVISAYLAYGSFSNDENVDLGATAKIVTKTILKDDPIDDKLEALVDPETQIEFLDGIYSLYYVTDIAETKQEFTLYPDNTFILTRKIVVPKNDNRDFASSGSYVINKNEVVLTFIEDRKRNFFPENVIRLKMLKDGNLKYDTEILERQ